MSNTAIWVTILLSCALIYALKLAGHVLPERWFTHPRLAPIVGLVTAALLAGLCVVQTFADGQALRVDARLVAVLVAALLLWRKVPFVVVVIAAAAVAAALRALGWG
jgi:branched-subunit amino acid transport protein